MLKSLSSLSVAALMVCATPVFAQDTATSDESTATEAPAVEPSLDLGQPVEDGPRLGERYSKEKHGDWDLACVKTDQDVDPCSLLQVILDSQGGPMAEVSLFRIEQQGSPAVAGATVIVPLETLLPQGLTISIDGGSAKRYNYSFCNPLGCVAQIGLIQADIDAMKKGAEATISLRPAQAPEQVINMALSLTGFTAGFNAVDVVKQ